MSFSVYLGSTLLKAKYEDKQVSAVLNFQRQTNKLYGTFFSFKFRAF